MKNMRTLRGFTLIEMMIVIAVMGILLLVAVPSFNSSMDTQRLKRVTDTLSAFLVNAKSEAIKRNATVRTVFQTSNSGKTWCVGMTTASTCDCTVASACQIDGVDRLIGSGDHTGVTLNQPTAAVNLAFDPVRGTINLNQTVRLASEAGTQTHIVIRQTGRIRLCAPAGVIGYPAC